MLLGTRFISWLVLGCRAGLGDGNHAIVLSSKAAMRRSVNWLLPAGLALLLVVVNFLFFTSNPNGDGIWLMMFRIIVMDYMIFIFGWICAWSSTWRWRRNQGFIEELVATNLRPGVVGNILFAGGLGIWCILLAALCVVDILLTFLLPERFGIVAFFTAMLNALTCVPVYIVLAWFHLETLRIAYWMFANGALPRTSLLNKAIANFFIIPIFVLLLTGLGGFVTLLSVGIVSLVGDAFGFGTNVGFERFTGWAIGSVPGLLLVGFVKRAIARQYEHGFWRSYLLYTWYGAGEISQPRVYPLHMYHLLGQWMAFLGNEERQTRVRMRSRNRGTTSPTEVWRPPAGGPKVPSEEPSPPEQ